MGKKAEPIKIVCQNLPDSWRLWEVVAELLGIQERCEVRILKKEEK